MKKLLIMLFISIIAFNFMCYGAKAITYSIVEIKDVSFYNVKRFSYNVIVSGQPSIQDLKEVSRQIVDKAKKESNFNALIIGFYDYPEYVGNFYTLGKTTYAPNGQWDEADSVNPGDYNTMSYKFELKNKDWSKQLTGDEVKVWSYFNNLLWTTNLADDEIAQRTASKFNINAKRVNDIYNKQTTWSSLDTLSKNDAVQPQEKIQDKGESINVEFRIEVNNINSGQPIVILKTNLPKDMKISISLRNKKIGYIAQTGGKIDGNGELTAGPFSKTGKPLKRGTYLLSITSVIPKFQPGEVKKLIGENGENLKGDLIKISNDIFGKSHIIEFNSKITIK